MYHRDDPSVIDRTLNWIGDRLSHLTDGSVSGATFLVLLALLVTAIVLAVVRAGRPQRKSTLTDQLDPLRRSPAVDHARLAAELESAGRYADALREWLRAAIATIEARGVLDAQPGRTGAEIARGAGALLPEAQGSLQQAMAAFDQVWFGERAATTADVAMARHAADAVRTARIRRGDVPSDTGYAVPR